jgi:uncharacterized SAM-binding protein YcdF (DUF218 family)
MLHDPPASLDGLIVLGARVNPQGQAGRVARMRLHHALELWRSRYPGTYLFITGGRRPGTIISEASAMAQWLRDWAAANWDAPAQESLTSSLILEELSHNTAASAHHLLPLVQQLNLTTLGLVSDTLHMRRAWFLFRRYFGRHGIAIHPFPVPGVLEHYWQRRRYLWLTKMALREGGAWLKVLGGLPWGRQRPR